MSVKQFDRRRFLKSSALSAGALAVPAIVPSRVLGKNAPSNLLQIGCIGTGRMGHGDMTACLSQGLESSAQARVVAVCDLDRMRAEHARQEVNGFYQKKLSDQPSPDVAVYEDYRELLARDDIDGVTVSTTDHWHALVAVAAANAGKDIYLQKPLTYSIGEGQKLVAAVRRNNVVLQTGSQQRSDATFRRACQLVRNGRLGKLHTIRVTLPTDSGIGDPTTMKVPANLNYEMWMGPTEPMPYSQDRVHPQAGFGRPGWLQIESYCRGMITGWGAHMFDTAQWGHGSDDTGPIEMEATGEFPDRGLFNVHTSFHAEGRYADGVRLIATSGSPAGVRFEGEAGWIDVGRSHFKAEPGDLADQPIGKGEQQLYESNNHMLNFLECMRSRTDPICPVEVGHRSNSICVITHIAMKLGRKLRWDPLAEKFRGDISANALLDYEHRAPWKV